MGENAPPIASIMMIAGAMCAETPVFHSRGFKTTCG
jgi:hypothetical protein